MRRAQDIEAITSIRNQVMHSWIGSASIDGSDVFAACKRAMLVGESPAAVTDELEFWMQYIVDAIESNHFELSIPAWQGFARQGMLGQGYTLYLLQLAHALERLSSVVPLLRAHPELLEHTNALADMLVKNPLMGSYGLQHCRLKERDLRRLLSKATACGMIMNDSGSSKAFAITQGFSYQVSPCSVMLSARSSQTAASRLATIEAI